MNKIAICTGANGGLGKNYCREMLSRDYHVVMACRNKQSGKQVLEELKQEFPDGSLELMSVDVGSLKSIERFSNDFISKHTRLDVLAHNAGVYFFDKARKTSTDNIELNFAVHYIGPFALTARLFPLLSATPGSRVVSMSSKEHHGSPVNQEDIQMKSDFAALGNMVAYSRSKWAIMAFTYELHRRIQKKGLQMNAVAAHPGVSITGIQHKGNPSRFQRAAIWVFGQLLSATPDEAVKPLVIASTEGKSGEFFGPTGFKEFKGPPGRVDPDPKTKDPQVGKALWEVAEKLTGLSFLE
jgi:NAD(P)-dependent dehydrogenase (short-subunit alcohol dehydrogenase family)